MRIKREDCVAVMVDVQSKLFPHIDANEELESNIIKLVKGLQVLGVPILITQQYTKGLGETIESLKELFGNEFRHIEKAEFSCLDNVDFQAEFMGLSRDHLIIFGIESHVCVLQTVIDAVAMGYIPVLVEDCISSRNPNDKTLAIVRAGYEGAIVTSSESLLFELTRISGTEEFKAISKIVK
ncbi:MAG: isochorismatase family protein [Candidatus Kapabacteria bacterium]|nr:isochorismatase family protein [Ignavibacteriota bacterium]MCW5884123.1 isochorismatase family protein [Candidatus Kapabacteria bacterium]